MKGRHRGNRIGIAILIGLACLPVLVPAQGKPPSITLAAVGDILLDRKVGDWIDRSGFDYPLARVRGVLEKADLVVGNLECPLTTAAKIRGKQFVFRAAPANVKAIRGFDLVSVANNHTLDCGPVGFEQTLATLRSAGMRLCGASLEPTVIERKGIRVGFIGYSDFPRGSGMVYYSDPGLASAISKARSRADVVVVFVHWGEEGSAMPSERQRQEARLLADAGADLVLGSHPHVLQPVEKIGKTVVAYSMGNFVFDAPSETAIFRFKISKNGVVSYDLVPVRIEKCQPRLAKAKSTPNRARPTMGRARASSLVNHSHRSVDPLISWVISPPRISPE